MRSSVRFSDWLTRKAGAACAIRPGSGNRRPLPLRRLIAPGPPPGLLREITPFSEKNLLPITHEALHQRRRSRRSKSVSGLHGDVAIVDVPVVAEPRRQPLLPDAGHQDQDGAGTTAVVVLCYGPQPVVDETGAEGPTPGAPRRSCGRREG